MFNILQKNYKGLNRNNRGLRESLNLFWKIINSIAKEWVKWKNISMNASPVLTKQNFR